MMPPPGSRAAHVGIFSETVAADQSLGEWADARERAWRRNLNRRDVVTLSRRELRLAGDIPAIQFVHEIGTGRSGKSQKTIAWAPGRVVYIDTETYSKDWEALQSQFALIVDSLVLQYPWTGVTAR